MPSPFPGMDPFLENHWGDVHTSLTTYARDQLRTKLPGDLRARVQEYVHLDENNEQPKQRWAPDVRIVKPPGGSLDRNPPAASGATATKALIIPFLTEWTERWIEIQDAHSGDLITSIEFLSPGNKQTREQRDAFQKKQKDLLQAGVNLVEIDLLRKGDWALTVPEIEVPDSHAYPYRVAVVRGDRPKFAECYPTPLQSTLPVIKIPLRIGQGDVLLELQPLVDAAWEQGDYADINYEKAPRPRFRPDDEAWIQERIAAWQQAKTTP